MKFIRIPLRSLYFITVILCGVVMAALFLRKTMSPSGFSSSLTRYWHQQVCRAFNIDITVHGQLPNEPMLLVANHISWFDISSVGSVITARYLSKYEVVGWPVIGWLAKKAGTVFIKRGASQAALHSMEKMTDALRQGDHVVLFPEGTTTDGHDVRKFHARLFQSAIESQRLIQPIVIRYPHENGVHPKVAFVNDMTIYQSAIGMLGEPHIKVEVHFLEPVTTQNKTRDELAQQCETVIRQKILSGDNNE